MGFLDKVKNLFTEEIEVEEVPIKKEVMKVEIPAPVVEEVKHTPKPVLVEEVEEREIVKREEKVRTPVFFDDKDFINLDQPKPVEKPKPKVVEPPKKEAYGVKKEEPKKKFAPSPIISPVYGVLDKNYHKEDIASKGERKATARYQSRMNSTKTLSIDDVMKKAYGTLEDELETTMNEPTIEFIHEEEVKPVVEQKVEKDIYSEFNLLDSMPINMEEFDSVPSIERNAEIDPLSGLELDVQEDDLMNDNFGDASHENLASDEDNMIAEAMDKMSDSGNSNDESIDLKESDLFNLIDSMYEKRDEE